MKSFTFSLEIEDPAYSAFDRKNDFTTVNVALPDGRQYVILVFTYKYLKTTIKNVLVSDTNLDGIYLLPPDLFVKKLSRSCIKAALNDLLKKGNLETILHRRVLIKNEQ